MITPLRLAVPALGMALLAALALPEEGASARVYPSKWKDGAKAAVSITMDDGYANQWRYMEPLLSTRGFSGTFFLVTQWLDQEGLWPRWREVVDAGHEIGSHGLSHVSLSNLESRDIDLELQWSRERIQAQLGVGQGLSFAYPFSEVSAALSEAVRRAGYVGARAGGDAPNASTPEDLYRVRSYHPTSSTTLREMNGWVDDIQASGGWLVLGVHGINDPDRPFPGSQEGWEPVPVERYVGLIDHIAATRDRLWVAPFGEVIRYIKARDAALATTLGTTDRLVRVRIEGLEEGPAVTFEAEVPDDWVLINVGREAGEPIVHSTWVTDGVRRVRFLVVPTTEITLSPAALKVRM